VITSSNFPLRIQKLATDVPNFSHQIGRIAETVEFQSIYLEGSNGFINSGTLTAQTADFRTSNGPIEGSFDASTSLSLVTSNSPINVDVGLDNIDPDTSTRLVITTSNGPIRSSISRFSPNAMRSKFEVGITTSNSVLEAEFPISPMNSTLLLSAQTSNARAAVVLDHAYEGEFHVQSSNFAPRVEQRETEDPLGQGRRKVIDRNREDRGHSEGRIRYDPPGMAASRVRVITSNAEASLTL